jgi:SAM-dependent MidA family methyltransferase
MEQALYHPEHGYYSSGRARIGRRGDFFTNVSVGPVFGELLARQFGEIWETLGRPTPFTIVEQGAHNGDFAADVLQFASERMPDFAAAIRYCIVEPFALVRQKQREKLRDDATWFERIEELEPFSGVHFSNELLDAMPVHLVRRTGDGWQERYVAIEDEHFQFVDGPLSDELRDVLEGLGEFPESCETEINLRARDWIDAVAEKLRRGYVLAVDYGYSRDAPERAGTLRCCAEHRVLDSPLSHLGHADITAHVDWTSVAEHGRRAGLQLAGFADQHHCLTGIISAAGDDELQQLNRRQLQTLLQPTMLGRTFQFLALSRDVPANAKLSGFKFARDPHIALGLHDTC